MEIVSIITDAFLFLLSLLFGACMPILPLVSVKNRWVRMAVMGLTEAVALYVSVTYLYGWIVVRGNVWGAVFNNAGIIAALFMGYVLGYFPCRYLANLPEGTYLLMLLRRKPDEKDED